MSREKQKNIRWVVLAALALIPVTLLGLGICLAIDQSDKLGNWVAVDAEVVDARIEVRRGKSTSYAPVISYRYAFEGRSYTSDVLAPVKTTGARAWAESMCARYPVGAKIQAYANPANPSRAFLLHEPSFLPYLLGLIGLALVGGWVLLRSLEQPGKPEDQGGDGELEPDSPLEERFAWGATFGLVDLGVIAAVIWHWFGVVAGPVAILPIAASAVSVAVAVLAIHLRLRVLRTLSRIGEARVWANGESFEQLEFRVELPAVDHITIETLTLVLKRQRVREQGNGTRAYLETETTSKVVCEDRSVVPGEDVELTESLRVPDLSGSKGPDEHIEMRLEIELVTGDAPTYRQSFGVPEVTVSGFDALDDILEPSLGAAR